MLELLAAAKKDHWIEALTWLLWSAVLGALPFWGAALIVWLLARSFPVRMLVEHAELAVYSAGLLSSAIPMLQREVKESPFRQPKWFLLASIIVVIIAAVVFGMVTFAGIPSATIQQTQRGVSASPFDLGRVLFLSVILTLLSFSLCFFTELFNNIRLDPNLWGVNEEQIKEVQQAMRRSLDKGDRP